MKIHRLREGRSKPHMGKFRRMVEQSPDVLFRFVFQPERRYEYVSPSVEGLLGYLPEDFYQHPGKVLQIAHLDDRPILENLLLGKPVPPYFQMRWIHKDGRVILTEQHVHMEYDAEGNFLAVEGVVRDISDRFSIEDTLTKLIYSSPVSIAIGSLVDGRFLVVNDGFVSLLGYEREEVLSRSPLEINLWAQPEHREQLIQSLQEGKEIRNQEVLLRAKDGQLIFGLATFTIVQYGGIPCLLSIVVDIRERKQQITELEAVASLTTALRDALTYDEIYPVILDQFQAALHSDASGVVIFDERMQNLVMKLARGAWAGWTGQELRNFTSVEILLQLRDQPYLDNLIQEKADVTNYGVVMDFKALGCIPLIGEKQVMGNLWFARRTPVRQEEMDILLEMGQTAANAIYRASLHEQTAIHLQRMTALRAIDQAISASLDLHLTLNILITQITSQLHIDAAGVMLYDPHLHTLKTSVFRGVNYPEFTGTRLRLGQSSAGRIAVTRELEFTTDPELLDKVFRDKMRMAGFVTYIGIPLIAKGKIKGVLQLFHSEKVEQNPDFIDFLNALGTQAAIAIETAELFEQLQRSNARLRLASEGAIEALSRVMEIHDHEQAGHARALAGLTLRLAERLGIDRDDLVHIQRGVLLHDIGKIAIPDEILFKPGPLSEEEWEIVRRHPLEARKMLEQIVDLRPALEIPVYHHEKWDGSGYPAGLKGDSIPLSARIFAVIDVWDALCSERPFRRAWSEEQALVYLTDQAGKLFDPAVVKAFVKIQQEKQEK